MKTYSVIVKSHCEMPDFENTYSEERLKSGYCPIPYVDDVDEEGNGMATPCGGKLIPLGYGGYRCSGCGVEFMEDK